MSMSTCQIRDNQKESDMPSALLRSNVFLANLPPAVAKIYIVSFRTHDNAGRQSS
jgi:hypothetical protein